MTRGFSSYHNYTKIIELLDGKEYSAKEIVNKTNIPTTTAYDLINELLKNGIIRIKKYNYNKTNQGMKKERVFTLEKKR